MLAINALNQLKHLFLNKDVTISVKTKLFKSYIKLKFLFNSELWTLTNNMQGKVDLFHGRIIKTFVLSIRCPTIVKKKKKNCQNEIRTVVYNNRKKQRKRFDKKARVDPSTPASSALHHALE